ncbi:MAG: multicopper oxidase domain-containing protein [Dermatophilaceae bacterium]
MTARATSTPIPSDHPTGTFWYHPHHHGTVADQMFGGLFGALLVAEPEEAGHGAGSGVGGQRHHADRRRRGRRGQPTTGDGGTGGRAGPHQRSAAPAHRRHLWLTATLARS